MTKRTQLQPVVAMNRLARTRAIALCLCGRAAQAQGVIVSDFGADFAAMAKLKDVTAKGKGNIGVLLPDTASSARYTSFDEPYLKKAFDMAGLSSSDLIV